MTTSVLQILLVSFICILLFGNLKNILKDLIKHIQYLKSIFRNK